MDLAKNLFGQFDAYPCTGSYVMNDVFYHIEKIIGVYNSTDGTASIKVKSWQKEGNTSYYYELQNLSGRINDFVREI